jgi:hypothetical protein
MTLIVVFAACAAVAVFSNPPLVPLGLWNKWRALEGLPIVPSYHEAKMGHRHSLPNVHKRDKEDENE